MGDKKVIGRIKFGDGMFYITRWKRGRWQGDRAIILWGFGNVRDEVINKVYLTRRNIDTWEIITYGGQYAKWIKYLKGGID